MAFQKRLGFRPSPHGPVPVKGRSLGGGTVSPSRGIACSRLTRRSVRYRPSRPSSLAGRFSRLRQRVPEGPRAPRYGPVGPKATDADPGTIPADRELNLPHSGKCSEEPLPPKPGGESSEEPSSPRSHPPRSAE